MEEDEDKLPLPPYWRKKESRSRPGEVYYINVKEKRTTWVHPTIEKRQREEKKKDEERRKRKRGKVEQSRFKPTFTSSKWSAAEDKEKSVPTRLCTQRKRTSLSAETNVFSEAESEAVLSAKTLSHPAKSKAACKASASKASTDSRKVVLKKNKDEQNNKRPDKQQETSKTKFVPRALTKAGVQKPKKPKLEPSKVSQTLREIMEMEKAAKVSKPKAGPVDPDPPKANGDKMDLEFNVCVSKDLMSVRNAQQSNNQAPELMDIVAQAAPGDAPWNVSEERKIFVVVDTNIFIHDLNLIDSLKDRFIPGFGRPRIVIPWVVIQELDTLKESSKSGTPWTLQTELLARQGINYLNNILQSGHPRVIGQTPTQDSQQTENSTIKVESSDDRILLCCQQWKLKNPMSSIVLLTEDKNLKNKAIIMDLKACITADLIRLLDEESLKPEIEGDKIQEQKLADEILSQVKNTLRQALTIVLETEMRVVYEELWLDVVLHKPPWSLIDILQSINKHWIAVFGLFLKAESHRYLERLLGHFKPGAVTITTMKQIRVVIAQCGAFLQPLYARSTYGVLDDTEGKLRFLYQVVGDVMNGTFEPLPLKDIVQNYPDRVALDGDRILTDDIRSSVTNSLQSVWNNINAIGVLLEQNMFTAGEARRTEYVKLFSHIVRAIATVNSTYREMLGVNILEADQHILPFIAVSKALDTVAKEACIRPWAGVHALSLQAFYAAPGCRDILEAGYGELQKYLDGYNNLWTRLTVNEQVQLQTLNQQDKEEPQQSADMIHQS